MDEKSFEQYYIELLNTSAKSGGMVRAQEILTKLNMMNYRFKIPFLNKWTGTDMIVHLLNMIKEFGMDESSVCPILQFIANITDKQEIVVCSLSVNVILHGLIDLWKTFYPRKDEKCLVLLIGAISAVVYCNGAYIIPESIKWLLQLEKDLESLATLSSSLEMKKTYIQCLSGLCLSSESREKLSDEFAFLCLQVFVKTLQSVNNVVEVNNFKVVYAAHRGVQHIVENSAGVHVDVIGPLLAVIRKHLMFGLPMSAADLPSVLQPIPIPDSFNLQPNNPVRTVKRKKKSRGKQSDKAGLGHKTANHSQSNNNKATEKPGIQPVQAHEPATSSVTDKILFPTSSESEFSDTEAGQRSKLHTFALKIRQIAFGNLYLVIKKTSRHVMYGYWSSFIADGSSRQNVSLLSCISRDPAQKARVASLTVLSAMLENSRSFLSVVCVESASESSFVSFSGMITSSLHFIHDSLLTAITKERSTVVQVHILKALAALARNAPFSKLQSGLVQSIINKIRVFMERTQDIDSQVAATNVMIALCDQYPPLAEVVWSITDEKIPLQDRKKLSMPLSNVSFDNITRSWLFDLLLGLLDSKKDASVLLRVSSLQALTALCKPYFIVAGLFVNQLKQVISDNIKSDNLSVKLHSVKLLEVLGSSLSQNPVELEIRLNFWQEILSKSVQTITQETVDPIIISQICDCLATVGSAVFEKLPNGLQIFCQTLLLGSTSDDNYLVRSAAVRSLAVFIMFPQLRKDIAFIEDVTQCVLVLLKDSVKSVQCNAAWSFGNLTDAVIVSAESDPDFRKSLRPRLLTQLFENAIAAFSNKDKVRFNIMRILGNLLRFCHESHVEVKELSELMVNSVDVIVSALSKDPLMKVRWNACLACGNFLSNQSLPIGDPEWTDAVYDALCNAVSTSKNYKVRIKAAAALSCPKLRDCFGAKFDEACICVANCFQKVQEETTDFEEYKFKDRLLEQLSLSLLHFFKLMKVGDFLSITKNIDTKQVKQELESCYHKLLQNKGSTMGQSEVTNNQETYVALGQLCEQEKFQLYKDASETWNKHLENETEASKNSSLNIFTFCDVYPKV